MKGALVPDSDHILRYVAPRHVDATEDGHLIVTGGGFTARPKDDNKPSCNWLECLPGLMEGQVEQIRRSARIAYAARGKLVRLNVGKVRQLVEDNTNDHRAVTVIHDPLAAEGRWSADPSRALMTNVPNENDPEGELVGDLIRQCVLEIFPARIP